MTIQAVVTYRRQQLNSTLCIHYWAYYCKLNLVPGRTVTECFSNLQQVTPPESCFWDTFPWKVYVGGLMLSWMSTSISSLCVCSSDTMSHTSDYIFLLSKWHESGGGVVSLEKMETRLSHLINGTIYSSFDISVYIWIYTCILYIHI